MAQNVTYDDRDPILDYSSGWFRSGTFNASSTGETGTLASSLITTGVNVTFVFPTPATEFFYFGIKRCCGGSYLICIDCDPNNRQFETINGVDTSDDGKNPPVVLYSRKFDEAGVHEVILMNQPDPAFNGNSQITLDKFLLTVPDPTGVETSSSSTIPTPSSVPSPSTSGTNLEKASRPMLAPILGGVLGGLAVLLILLGIWLCMRRQSRRPVYSAEEQASGPNLIAQSPASESIRGPSSRFTASTGIGSVATFSTAAVSSRREVDAGRIDDYLSSPEDTLPPEYGQVFRPNRASRSHSLPPREPEPPLPPLKPRR
ncbi:hypothetical protein DFH08DRAFT_872597 [Mycena albidolilacea]|uniref:Uncharacterized protein n=1 Tax=Mycena albidolilacea TaxID=1033008 RepID=A0AAD6ZX64_9AGAR|nr:hypothetical protein DFH08DRAFT_872597 [Mycena albidolilacea]